MIFTYRYWEKFCKQLADNGRISIPAKDVKRGAETFLVLKHDIENTVPRAYQLALIEHKYGHRGTYYAHAYLLDKKENVELLRKMQKMGHEISYHYDVMDSNRGNIEKAIEEFKENIHRFEMLGFHISTVCQHGNPVVERVGYTSNRDFFRSQIVQALYPYIADIMVDYKTKYEVDYSYYSDAGRKFKLIYDPINNDIINSDDKNIPYETLESMFGNLNKAAIVSTHPHRWTKTSAEYVIKEYLFKFIKAVAKLFMKIPVFKRIMSKYYYLAKKI